VETRWLPGVVPEDRLRRRELSSGGHLRRKLEHHALAEGLLLPRAVRPSRAVRAAPEKGGAGRLPQSLLRGLELQGGPFPGRAPEPSAAGGQRLVRLDQRAVAAEVEELQGCVLHLDVAYRDGAVIADHHAGKHAARAAAQQLRAAVAVEVRQQDRFVS